MLTRIETPPVIDSPLSRLDARWRLAALVIAGATVASLRTLIVAVAALAAVVALAAVARMPWKMVAERAEGVAWLLALLVVPMLLFSPLSWSDAAALSALVAFRAISLLLLGVVLLITASPDQTLRATSALGMPSLLTRLGLLSYRYLFVLADELARLRLALRLRAFRNRPDLHSYRTVAATTGTLLVRGQDRAERVYAAMRCRGFAGAMPTLTSFRTRIADVAFLLAAIAACSLMVWLDRWVIA